MKMACINRVIDIGRHGGDIERNLLNQQHVKNATCIAYASAAENQAASRVCIINAYGVTNISKRGRRAALARKL